MRGHVQQRGKNSWRIKVFVGRDAAGVRRYVERTVRGTRRPRREVLDAGVAVRVEAGDPAVRALPREPHRLGDMSDGHPELSNAVHEQPAPVHSHTGVTVRHEDLRVVKRQTPQCLEVFTRQRMSPTSRPSTTS